MNKLFSALVVGGSLLVAGCSEDDGSRDGREVVTGPDAAAETGEPVADGGATPIADGGSELAPCFCDRETCCDDGVLEEGFECCWATSC